MSEWVIHNSSKEDNKNRYGLMHKNCSAFNYINSIICGQCRKPIPEKYIKLRNMLNFMEKL